MRASGAFELQIEPAREAQPVRVALVLLHAVPDARGVVRLTPDCMRLDELEAAINAIQDELDVLRAEARRVFAGVPGHA